VGRATLAERHQPVAEHLPLIRHHVVRRKAGGNGLHELHQGGLPLIFLLPVGNLTAYDEDRGSDHRLPAAAVAVEAAGATSGAGFFLPKSRAPTIPIS